MLEDIISCAASYLTYRYLVTPSLEWCPGVRPCFPDTSENPQTPVGTAKQIYDFLLPEVQDACKTAPTGLLLSGGIDSAILAAMLPKGTRAYTIVFESPAAKPEDVLAQVYAKTCGLEWHPVRVTWNDYLQAEDVLMRHKLAPLHPVEVALHKAAEQAGKDGLTTLIVGNGADSTFGGMDKLLGEDWTPSAFATRYTFVNPAQTLKSWNGCPDMFAAYAQNATFDTQGFLKTVHGLGVVQAFENALTTAGISCIAPYESLRLNAQLDLERIRSGEPKYLLTELFRSLYPGIEPPRKIPFARPMDDWLNACPAPASRIFRNDLDMSLFTGDQKYLIRCLDRFLKLIREDGICPSAQ